MKNNSASNLRKSIENKEARQQKKALLFQQNKKQINDFLDAVLSNIQYLETGCQPYSYLVKTKFGTERRIGTRYFARLIRPIIFRIKNNELNKPVKDVVMERIKYKAITISPPIEYAEYAEYVESTTIDAAIIPKIKLIILGRCIDIIKGQLFFE